MKLVVGSLEIRFLFQCETHHSEPVFLVHQSLLLLQWIMRCDQKPHLIKSSFLANGTCQLDMSIMDGIERSAKKTYGADN